MKTHTLKCWPAHFQAVKRGEKSFEYRSDDRGFEVGDVLVLREFDPETETESGEEFSVRVTYIARGSLIPAGDCVMSIEPADDREKRIKSFALRLIEQGRFVWFDVHNAIRAAQESLDSLDAASVPSKEVSRG